MPHGAIRFMYAATVVPLMADFNRYVIEVDVTKPANPPSGASERTERVVFSTAAVSASAARSSVTHSIEQMPFMSEHEFVRIEKQND